MKELKPLKGFSIDGETRDDEEQLKELLSMYALYVEEPTPIMTDNGPRLKYIHLEDNQHLITDDTILVSVGKTRTGFLLLDGDARRIFKDDVQFVSYS